MRNLNNFEEKLHLLHTMKCTANTGKGNVLKWKKNISIYKRDPLY